MEEITETFEIQIDEKPNGAIIRINDVKNCRLRICCIPRELVFDEQGEVRTFIDITYPNLNMAYKRAIKITNVAIITDTQIPKNLQLSKLGKRFKKS